MLWSYDEHRDKKKKKKKKGTEEISLTSDYFKRCTYSYLQLLKAISVIVVSKNK